MASESAEKSLAMEGGEWIEGAQRDRVAGWKRSIQSVFCISVEVGEG